MQLLFFQYFDTAILKYFDPAIFRYLTQLFWQTDFFQILVSEVLPVAADVLAVVPADPCVHAGQLENCNNDVLLGYHKKLNYQPCSGINYS